MKYMDFKGFALALFNNWISMMSGIGSIVFAILGFIPHKTFGFFKEPKMQRKIFWSIALLCFFLASISAWTNEHQKVIEIEKQLDKSKPKLEGVIDFISIASFGKNNLNTQITLAATIYNKGAPSCAKDLIVYINYDGKIIQAPILSVSSIQDFTIILPHTHEKIKYTANDYLPRKAGSPIATGGSVQGFMVIGVDIPRENIFYKASFTLNFRDPWGGEYNSAPANFKSGLQM